MNSVFSFNKYKKCFFFTFGSWLLAEKFSFCPKNNGFARVWGGCSPPSPVARTPMYKILLHVNIQCYTIYSYCNNRLAHCQQAFKIFGAHTIWKLISNSNWRIVSRPNTVCVTALPCEILITILFVFTYLKQLTSYFGSNCHFLSKCHGNNNFKRIVPDEYYTY